jgi:hypothetical protein
MNFIDESICLLADNVRSELLQFTDHGTYWIHSLLEAVLQDLQFPYEYFISVLPLGRYCFILCSAESC